MSASRHKAASSRKKKITVVAILTAALVLGGGTSAFAWWTSQGSGTGAASAGTATPFTIAAVTPTGPALSPGSTQTVTFTVHNPSTGPQYLTNLVVTVASAGGVAWGTAATCSANDYTVGAVTFTPGDMAGSATQTGSVVITMKDSSTSQDGCKNASVPLYFVAS